MPVLIPKPSPETAEEVWRICCSRTTIRKAKQLIDDLVEREYRRNGWPAPNAEQQRAYLAGLLSIMDPRGESHDQAGDDTARSAGVYDTPIAKITA